jgi:hypothetical protein
MRLLSSLLLAAAFGGLTVLGVQAQCPPGPKAAPVPPAVEQPATPTAEPKVVQGLLGDAGKRILLRHVRSRAIDTLVSDGVTVPGGGKRTYTRAEAKKAVAGIDDDTILGLAAEKVPAAFQAGEGGRLAALVDWLLAHQDQIMALVKLVMSLLLLFGDDAAP